MKHPMKWEKKKKPSKVGIQNLPNGTESFYQTIEPSKRARLDELDKKSKALALQAVKDGWTSEQLKEYSKPIQNEIDSVMSELSGGGTYRLPTKKEQDNLSYQNKQEFKQAQRDAGIPVPEYDVKGNETEHQALLKYDDYQKAATERERLNFTERTTSLQSISDAHDLFNKTVSKWSKGEATSDEVKSAQAVFDSETNKSVIDYISSTSSDAAKDIAKYATINSRITAGEPVSDFEKKYVYETKKKAIDQLSQEAFANYYELEQSGDIDAYAKGVNIINAKVKGLTDSGKMTESAANNINTELAQLKDKTGVGDDTIEKLQDGYNKLSVLSKASDSIDQLNNDAYSQKQEDKWVEEDRDKWNKEHPFLSVPLEFSKGVVKAMGTAAISLAQTPAAYGQTDSKYTSSDLAFDWMQDLKDNPTFNPLSEKAPEYLKFASELGSAIGNIATFSVGGPSAAATSGIAFITTFPDIYQQARDLGMNTSDAKLYSTFISTVSALSESIVPDSKYFTEGIQNSVLRAWRSGSSVKESTRLALKALPKSMESYLENSGKEGFEEGVSAIAQPIAEQLTNDIRGVNSYGGFDVEEFNHSILIGAASGGFMRVFNRAEEKTPLEKSVVRGMAENYDVIMPELVKTDPIVAKEFEESVSSTVESLESLKSHESWDGMSEVDKDHALELTQKMSSIEEEQAKLKKIRVEDASKEAELKKIEDELNALFNKEGSTVVPPSSTTIEPINLTFEKTDGTKIDKSIDSSDTKDVKTEEASVEASAANTKSLQNMNTPRNGGLVANVVKSSSDATRNGKNKELLDELSNEESVESGIKKAEELIGLNEPMARRLLGDGVVDSIKNVSVINEGNKVEPVVNANENGSEKMASVPSEATPQEGNDVGGKEGVEKSELANRIRNNIKELPEKYFNDEEANKNWKDIAESRKKIRALSDKKLLEEVRKGMNGEKINQAIYESYFGMDITAKDIETEIKKITTASQPTPKSEAGKEGVVEIKNEGKADKPTNQSVTERLSINNPFYIKVEDALSKLGIIKKYNPETKEGDVVGGYVQSDSKGGFASGDMYFKEDGSISYIKDGVIVEFDKNGNVISENTKQAKVEKLKTDIEGKKTAIKSLEETRDSENFKYKTVNEYDALGNTKKVKRLKTEQELKDSTDKINQQIEKSKAELKELEKQQPTPKEEVVKEGEVTPQEGNVLNDMYFDISKKGYEENVAKYKSQEIKNSDDGSVYITISKNQKIPLNIGLLSSGNKYVIAPNDIYFYNSTANEIQIAVKAGERIELIAFTSDGTIYTPKIKLSNYETGRSYPLSWLTNKNTNISSNDYIDLFQDIVFNGNELALKPTTKAEVGKEGEVNNNPAPRKEESKPIENEIKQEEIDETPVYFPEIEMDFLGKGKDARQLKSSVSKILLDKLSPDAAKKMYRKHEDLRRRFEALKALIKCK